MYNIGGTMRLRKRRKFVNHKKRIMYFSLFFLVLFISVGYAYLSRALSINGHTELRANTWNIHFENLSIKEGSVEAVTPAAIDGNTTTINYSIKHSSKKTSYWWFTFSSHSTSSYTIISLIFNSSIHFW